MKYAVYSFVVIGLFLISCNPKPPPNEGLSDSIIEKNCSSFTGCEQLTCVFENCWCSPREKGETILFSSGNTITDKAKAKEAVEKYFQYSPDQRMEYNETDSLGYNWYQLYYSEEMFTIGPEGNLYLVDCI